MSYEIIRRLARIEEKLDLLILRSYNHSKSLRTAIIEFKSLPGSINNKESGISLEGLLHLIEGNIPDRCGINALARAGIRTVEDLFAKEPRQLLAIRGFGKNALANLEAQLEIKGYSREAKSQPQR